MARTSNKALAQMEALKSMGVGGELPSPETSDFVQMAAQSTPSKFRGTSQPVAQIDLAGQEAIVDRKIEQTGQNAVTQSRAWDMMGNILGFKTQTDWEDAKAGIDAQQAEIARQDQMLAEAQAAAEIKAINDRNAAADTLYAGAEDSLASILPQSKEDEQKLASAMIDLKTGTELMRSNDPKNQEMGRKMVETSIATGQALADSNEIANARKQEFAAEQSIRVGNLEETKRANRAREAEQRRSNLATEAQARTAHKSQLELSAQNQFNTSVAAPYQSADALLNKADNALEEAYRTGDRTLLYAAGVSIAKSLDDGGVVNERNVEALMGQGGAMRGLASQWNTGSGKVSEAEYNRYKALINSGRKSIDESYEARRRMAVGAANSQGLDGSTVYKPYELQPRAERAPVTPEEGSVIGGITEIAIDRGKGALAGAAVGGTAGSLVGGVGAVPGAVGGAVVGGLVGADNVRKMIPGN